MDDLHQSDQEVLATFQTILLVEPFRIILIFAHEYLELFLATFPIWTRR